MHEIMPMLLVIYHDAVADDGGGDVCEEICHKKIS
jgi:hypothetical protein